MEDKSPLDSLIVAAFASFAKVDFELIRLEEPAKTIVVITSAQGRIDNGGLRCFFENDFPGAPPYLLFEEAYARIGCVEIATAIKHAVKSFNFVDPENRIAERNAYMNANSSEETQAVAEWDDSGCGDLGVWSNLLMWAIEKGDHAID